MLTELLTADTGETRDFSVCRALWGTAGPTFLSKGHEGAMKLVGSRELVKGTIPPLIQIPVIKTILRQLRLTSKLPLRRYKHWQTMHIIKVEYVLINVCFHLLVVLANIRSVLVVSPENDRRDPQLPTSTRLRSMEPPPREAKKDGGRVWVPASIVQGAAAAGPSCPFLL